MKTKFNLYRTISKYLRFTLLVAGVLYLLTTTDSCKKVDNTGTTTDSFKYSLNDLLGTWQRHSLASYTNSGFWLTGTIITSMGPSSISVVTSGGGKWDSTYVGVGVSIASDGVITSASDHAAHGYLSSDKNLLVVTTKRATPNPGYTLIFDQKTVPGTIYSSADFIGTWQTHSIVIGGNWTGWIHAVSIMDNTPSYNSTIVESDGTNGVQLSETGSISSVGTITKFGTDGTNTMHETDHNGFMSADKKLMTSTMTYAGGGGVLSISQKVVAGTAYSKADLQGTWQLHSILVGSESWTEHGILTIDASGNGIISNMVQDNGGTFNNPGTIALSISLDGIVTYGTDFHGFLSADKKLVIGTKGDDSGHAYSLVALQKMP